MASSLHVAATQLGLNLTSYEEVALYTVLPNRTKDVYPRFI